MISGGTRTNVVAAEARAEVDIRIARLKDAAALDKKFRGLRPFDKRCSIQVEGGLNRPPMERSPAIRKLFQTARGLRQGTGRGAGGIVHRRRLGRQFHRGAGRSDAGWIGRRRRRRACGQREHSARSHRGSDGAAGDAALARYKQAARITRASVVLFGWKHGPQIEQQPAVFDPRHHRRIAQDGSAAPLPPRRRNRSRSTSFVAAARAWSRRRSPSCLRSPSRTNAGQPLSEDFRARPQFFARLRDHAQRWNLVPAFQKRLRSVVSSA